MDTSADAQSLFADWRVADVMASDCPSRAVLQHLTSRWGALVMVALAMGPHRFSGLRRAVRGISERMLAQTLQDLEADGFVLRTAHPVVPPHVDYELTALGKEAAAHLVPLIRWIEGSLPRIMAARLDAAADQGARRRHGARSDAAGRTGHGSPPETAVP